MPVYRKLAIASIAALGLLVASPLVTGTAEAKSHISIGLGFDFGPAVYTQPYYPAPPIYYEPSPVYVAPPPAYYYPEPTVYSPPPPPVYYVPAPGYYVPRPVYERFW